MRLFLLVLSLSLLLTPAVAAELHRIPLAGLTAEQVAALTADRAVKHFLEFEDELVVASPAGRLPAAFRTRASALPLREDLPAPVLASRRGADSPLDDLRGELHILHEERAYTLFQAPAEILGRLEREQSNHFRLEPFNRTMRLRVPAERIVPAKSRGKSQGKAPDAKVSIDRLRAAVVELENFKTRYTYSAQYGESAKRMAERFRALGLEVSFHEYNDGGRMQVNVVAQKKGGAADESEKPFYLIGAHLDSTSNQPQTLAPGADDNASGCAGALELATLFAGHPKAHRIRYVLFAGEEVGLRGSTAYVKELQRTGEIKRLAGAVVYDMIGWDRIPPLSALVETKEFTRPFFTPFLEAAASLGGKLKCTVNLSPWGSDHMPFLRANIPCFLFIEDEFETNLNYHKTTDLSKDVNFDLTAEMVRVTAAGLEALLSR